MTEDIERATAHRPWPLPDGPWVMFQSWRKQLFAHWPIAAAALREHIPAALDLDEFDGSAWLGLTPFLLTGLRIRGLPELPVAAEFPELNLRTYVTVNDRPGVYFFSLDAASQLAVLGARAGYGLPYHHAEMEITSEADGWTRYRSRRVGDAAELEMRYRPMSAPTFHATRGTLDYFLIERYALYVVRGEKVMRGDIHHRLWPLQHASADFERNTIAGAAGIRLPDVAPVLHYSPQQDTLIWPLATAA